MLLTYHPKIKWQLQIKGRQSKVQEPQGQGLSTLPLAIKSTWNIQSFKEGLMNFFFMWHLHTTPFDTQYIISSSDISVYVLSLILFEILFHSLLLPIISI